MQFRVPQNIDLEDKVVGPFTMKQFLYLLVGGILDYVYLKFFNFYLFLLFAIPTTIFFIAMAAFRYQDQPFPKFLQSLVLFALKPKHRIWGKNAPEPEYVIRKKEAPKPKAESRYVSKTELEKLAQIVDTRGWGKNMNQMPPNARVSMQDRVKSHDQTENRIDFQ